MPTHEEEMMRASGSPRLFRATAAAVLGAVSSLPFLHAAAGDPAWAQCLGPALFGLLMGLPVAHQEVRGHLGRPVGKGVPRRLPLRLPVLAALAVGAVIFAVLEERVVDLFNHQPPFRLRAVIAGALFASLASAAGRVLFSTGGSADG